MARGRDRSLYPRSHSGRKLWEQGLHFGGPAIHHQYAPQVNRAEPYQQPQLQNEIPGMESMADINPQACD